MYIRRVVIENIKSFVRLDFRFDSKLGTGGGWNVITGDNSSGKTTLLKAIALAMVGPDITRVLQPNLDGWIRTGSDSGTVAIEVAASREDSFTKGRRYERPFWSEIQFSRARHETAMQQGKKYRGKGKGPTNGPWDENAHGWFSVGYGPFRRLYGSSPEAQRLMSSPGRVSNFATMFREDATLGECELWLRELQYKSLEKKETEQQLLNSALEVLNDDFLRHGLKVDRVDSDGVWLRHTNGFVLALKDMSEGYRAALAMLMDIVRQMAMTYGPANLTVRKDGVVTIPHPGVVLIDEVDAHLHPEWQRTIGFWLKERFPHVQFIVTTHSAFICQAADENAIYHLPAPDSRQEPFQVTGEDYWKIVRSKAETIYLSPVFGLEHTRSTRAVEARTRFAHLQSKRSSARLTSRDAEEFEQLQMFIDEDEKQDQTLVDFSAK